MTRPNRPDTKFMVLLGSLFLSSIARIALAQSCPSGTTPCGADYCTPSGATCCAGVGRPDLYCPGGQQCNANGTCGVTPSTGGSGGVTCPTGSSPCGANYCAPTGTTCCASVGRPDHYCPGSQQCNADGTCSTGTGAGGGASITTNGNVVFVTAGSGGCVAQSCNDGTTCDERVGGRLICSFTCNDLAAFNDCVRQGGEALYACSHGTPVGSSGGTGPGGSVGGGSSGNGGGGSCPNGGTPCGSLCCSVSQPYCSIGVEDGKAACSAGPPHQGGTDSTGGVGCSMAVTPVRPGSTAGSLGLAFVASLLLVACTRTRRRRPVASRYSGGDHR
jgi:loricrin